MAKKMPWEAPDMAAPTLKDIEAEKAKADAFGATIEGGCWFSHVGGIDDMEKSYGRRSRERDEGTTTEEPSVDTGVEPG